MEKRPGQLDPSDGEGCRGIRVRARLQFSGSLDNHWMVSSLPWHINNQSKKSEHQDELHVLLCPIPEEHFIAQK